MRKSLYKIPAAIKTAVLILFCLFFSALAVSCIDTFTSPATSDPGEGMGRLRVSLSGGTGRTLYPDVEFTKYVLHITPDHAGLTIDDVVWSGAAEKEVELPGGKYTIQATAYIKAGETEYPAARSVNTSLTIDQGTLKNVTIAVTTPIAGDPGTFRYSISIPPSVTVSFELSRADGTGNPYTDNISTSASNVPLSHPAGIYILMVTATHSNEKKVVRTEVVHIYQRAVTEAVYVFPITDFNEPSNLSGTVDVLIDGVRPTGPVEVLVYSDPQFQKQIGTSSPVIWSGGPDVPGTWAAPILNFNGSSKTYFRIRAKITPEDSEYYYAIPHIGSTPIFINTPVIDQAGIELGTITVTDEADTTIITAPDEDIELYNDYLYPLSKTAHNSFKLWIDPNAGITSIQWRVDGEIVTGATGVEFTINADDYDIGVHYASVLVWKNGAPYLKEFRFRVTE
jgi:hypothetical protein